MRKKQRNQIIIAVLGIAIIGWFGYSVATRPSYDLAQASERPFKGRADAAIVITEYSDFECPACKAAQPLVQYLDETYGANIKIEYRHLPLRQIHPKAYDAAIASECANDQGKFWELHDLLFGYQPNISTSQIKDFAQTIEGLDTAQFNACLDTRARKDLVDEDMKNARTLGLNSTPSFLYNGQYVQNRALLEEMIRRDLGLPAQE